jgi:predicted amidophosphoribosyltransferase
MKCFYCKSNLPSNSVSDICENCLFHLDDDDSDYDDNLQKDIEAILNKTGATPARFIE